MNIHHETLKQLKAYYKPGTKVELIRMNDPYRKMPTGQRGEVIHVDDAGTVHCVWSNGSTLGIVFGEDECRKIED
jgi:hypothetical protein